MLLPVIAACLIVLFLACWIFLRIVKAKNSQILNKAVETDKFQELLTTAKKTPTPEKQADVVSYLDRRIIALQKTTRPPLKFLQPLHEKLRLRYKWYSNLFLDPTCAYESADEEIIAIQNSTRTTFKFFQPLHEKLRQRSSLYYRWHLRPSTNIVHLGLLALYSVFVIAIVGLMTQDSYAGVDFAPEVVEKNIDYSQIYQSVNKDAVEIPSKRTANQKVFKNPDGTEQYIISGGPLHYKDADNNWKEIDSTIDPLPDGSGFLMNKSVYSAKFSKNFTSDQLLEIDKEGEKFSLKPGELSFTNIAESQLISIPNNINGEANKHEVLYKDAYGAGLDFSYETQDLQLNKKLTINSFESLPALSETLLNNETSLELDITSSINPDQEIFIDEVPWDGTETTIENQNIIFKKEGKVIWHLTPALAWDAQGKDKAIYGKTVLSKAGNQLNLSVLFPYSYLETAQYPVVIDPDYYGTATDGHIVGKANNKCDTAPNYSTAHSTGNLGPYTAGPTYTTMIVGQKADLECYIYRAFLEFDTSGIDDSYTVSQANLYMKASADGTSSADFTVRVHKYNWTSPLSSDATARDAAYDGAIAATTGAVDWKNTADGNFATNTYFSSANLDNTWIQKGATKTQFALVSSRDVAQNVPVGYAYYETVTLYSQDHATATNRPYLSVTAAPASVTRYWIDGDGGNWSDTANWSDASGGTGGASVPGAGDTAIFDNAGGTRNGALTINTAVNVATLTFDTSYTGAITQGANTITTSAAMNLTGTSLTMGAAVTASGTLTVAAGKTLDLNGNAITVGSTFTVNGILQLKGTETITGTPTLASGSTVTYNDTAASSRAIQNWSYQNLTISATGASYIAPAADLSVGGNFTLGAATTFNTRNTSDRTLNITGNVDIDGGFTANGSTINCGGNWDHSGTAIFTRGTSTVNFTGTGSISVTNNWNNDKTFYNLSVAAGTKTTTLSSAVGVNGTLTFGAGTLAGAWSNFAVYNSIADATPLSINAGATINQLSINVVMSAATNIPSSTKYPQLNIFGDAAASRTATLLGNITTTGLSVSGQHNGDYGILNTGGYTIQTGSFSIGTTGNLTKYGKLIASGSAITATGNVDIFASDASGANELQADSSTINVAGNFTNSDTFTKGTSTVVFNKTSSSQTLNSGGTAAANTFNNLSHTGAGTLQLLTNNINIDGDFSNTSGIFNANNLNMTVAGNWTNSATFTSGTNTVTFNGTSTTTISGTNTFYNLTFDSTSGAKTVKVTAATTQTISAGGMLSLSGAASDKKITYQSTTDGGGVGDRFTFAIPGAITGVNHANIRDFYTSGSTITPVPSTCTNNGNTNWVWNITPTNDFLTFINPYSGTTNTAVSDNTTEWNFRALVTDADGSTDINYIELHLANSADSAAPYDSIKLRWTEGTDTFSEEADTQDAITLTSTSSESNASGNQWTLDFKVRIDNDFLAKDTLYAAELYALDDSSAADTDNYAEKYQVTNLTLSLGVDSGVMAFGSLLPGSVITGTTIISITTNYANGYSLSADDGIVGTNSALRHSDTTTRIADYTGTISVPTTWSGIGLGICVFDATNKNTSLWGTGSSETDSSNKYAGVPETAETIHSKTGSPTSSDQTSVGYKLVVPNSQKTGDYSGDITYTATGVLN